MSSIEQEGGGTYGKKERKGAMTSEEYGCRAKSSVEQEGGATSSALGSLRSRPHWEVGFSKGQYSLLCHLNTDSKYVLFFWYNFLFQL